MPSGFPLQDTGPGMAELFHDLQVEQDEQRDAENAKLREAAKVCRDTYCKIVPGKRTWDQLSEQEKRVDMVCLKAAFDALG